jgi:hypothetical protein
MAKQRVVHGGSIEVPTAEELAERLKTPYERLVLSLGAADSIEEIHDDIPTKGTRSIATAYQRGGGSDNYVIAPAIMQQLCAHRPGRIAGTIQNIGGGDCFTYLAPLTFLQRMGGVPGTINGVIVGWIPADGGSFDFKLTNDCWGGPVCVYSQLGTTLVWGEH